MVTIPEEYRDLFEKPSFAFVATLLPDGAPHVAPTWVGLDGDHLLVNAVRGSRKDRNLRKDSRIALAIADPENPYRYLAVRGEAIDICAEGTRERLEEMIERYTGETNYPGPEGDRVLITVRPDDTSGQLPPPQQL